MPEPFEDQRDSGDESKEVVTVNKQEINGLGCLTEEVGPVDPVEENRRLTNEIPTEASWPRVRDSIIARAEIDRRLAAALAEAGRSALGMPGTVDTFKAMLDRAGLALVLA